MLSIRAHHHSIKLARPFSISRGTRTHAELVRVTVRYKDFEAEGECTPYPRYGESVDSVISQVTEFAKTLTLLTPNEARLSCNLFQPVLLVMPWIAHCGLSRLNLPTVTFLPHYFVSLQV